MATKIKWSSLDYATRDALSELMEKTGASYREMEDMAKGEITYSRIRDIKMGNKAPARLSEFTTICRICGQNPVPIFQKIVNTPNSKPTK